MRLKTVALAVILISVGCGSGSSTQPAASSSGTASKYAKFFQGVSGQSIVYWTQGGGTILTAMQATVFSELSTRAGVSVRGETYCCDLAKLKAQQDTGNPQWDVLEFGDGAQQATALKNGWLEKFPTDFPFDQLEPRTYNDYGIVKERYAAVLTWNTKLWPLSGTHPTKLTDLFDTAHFPGKRCLLKSYSFGGNLEAALLADGVAPAQMYPLDVQRALRKLSTIKNQIVWWTSGDQSTQYLINGECSIGLTFNGRPYSRVKNQGAPLAIGWDHAITLNGWNGIQKGTAHKNASLAYFACQVLCTNAIDQYVLQITYVTPVKGIYDTLDPAVKPWVAAGPNVANAIPQDDNYYAAHDQELTALWNQWLQS